MDPITKALHETWKSIVNEGKDILFKTEYDYSNDPENRDDGWEQNPDYLNYTPKQDDRTPPSRWRRKTNYNPKPKPAPTPGKTPYDDRAGDAPTPGGRGLSDYLKPKPTPGGRIPQELIDQLKPKPTPGGRIPGKDPEYILPGLRPNPRPTIFPEPKPKPAPTPGDGSWGGSKPKPGTGAWGGAQPKQPKYGPDGNFIGFVDGTTPEPTPTPTPKLIPYINPDPSPFPSPHYYERPKFDQIAMEPKPIIPTRSPAPQPAAPATTGSGLLNNIMNFNKKAYNSVTGSLPTMPKIYEERDAEGQMAKGELMVLASKAQELANMMKDDTQLEAWVQSKITKAKDYISSVHDYMNGNPDKID